MIIRWFGKVGSLYKEKLKLALIINVICKDRIIVCL